MEERIDMKISAVLLLQQSTNDLFVQRPFWLSRKEKMIRASSAAGLPHFHLPRSPKAMAGRSFTIMSFTTMVYDMLELSFCVVLSG